MIGTKYFREDMLASTSSDEFQGEGGGEVLKWTMAPTIFQTNKYLLLYVLFA